MQEARSPNYQPYKPVFDAVKFHALIVYVAKWSEENHDEWFGATKLNKILYFVDFLAFRRRGHPITGATYMRLSEGPVPREILKALDVLQGEGAIAVHPREFFQYVQKRAYALIAPNPNAFQPAERAIIDEVLEALRGKSASDVSAISHQELGWQLARDGETIAYETAWFKPRNEVPADLEQSLYESKQ